MPESRPVPSLDNCQSQTVPEHSVARPGFRAEVKIGDSPFMMTQETASFPEYLSPQSRGGSPVHFYLYVEDADALFNQAIAAGAKQLQPLTDQFYGDRVGGVTDPFGHVWTISTHVEDIPPEEMHRRSQEMVKQAQKK